MSEMHGGNIYQHSECIDFLANFNPLGMPEQVRSQVIRNAGLWAHYPDPACSALTAEIAKHQDVTPAQVVCGNGADDLIWRIAQTLRPKTALLPVPTFTEYARALGSVGCEVHCHALSPENDFLLTKRFLEALRPGLELVVLCNPNNPTGRLIPTECLAEICRKCEENETFLLVDECFLDLVAGGDAYSAKPFLTPHVIVLNAFTKTYAMPGLRLGFAVFGDKKAAEKVQIMGQYWSVSVPAQIAGAAALRETAYLAASQKYIGEERAFLTQALTTSGLHVFPSDANFLLFQGKIGLRQKLLQKHILIRCCDNFEGLDATFYRIAVRTHPENEQLIHALRRYL